MTSRVGSSFSLLFCVFRFCLAVVVVVRRLFGLWWGFHTPTFTSTWKQKKLPLVLPPGTTSIVKNTRRERSWCCLPSPTPTAFLLGFGVAASSPLAYLTPTNDDDEASTKSLPAVMLSSIAIMLPRSPWSTRARRHEFEIGLG